VLEAAFSAMIGSHVILLNRRLNGVAFEVCDTHCVSVDDCDLAVAEKEDVACVLQNRRNVGSDEKLAVSETDNDRADPGEQR
jgi:hypothetical protein